MRTAIISPTGLLTRYCNTGYHLALAHMVMESIEYAEFYKGCTDRGEYVILDHSVIELGKPMNLTALVKTAKAINASEVCMPDQPGQPDYGYYWAENYGQELAKKLDMMVNLMIIPQGQDVKEWMYWYEKMVTTFTFVDTVGIPKSLREDRRLVCDILSRDRHEGLAYHLLGTWGNPLEIKSLAYSHEWIRGFDSKIPVRLGQLGIALHPVKGLLFEGRYELPPLRFDMDDDPMPIITSHNVKIMKAWADGRNLAEVVTLGAQGTRR